MRIIIPTKGRSQTISTHKVFDGCDYYVLVHNQEEYRDYSRNPSIDPGYLIISDVAPDAYGLTRQREWAMKHLISPGEWFVFADDNIKRITAVDEEYYDETVLPVKDGNRDLWDPVYDTNCDMSRFEDVADDTIFIADQVGATMCGFAINSNYYFREKKWHTVGYVIGKLTIWKNDPFSFNHEITMEDFYNTAQHLLNDGAVVINNFCWPEANHYEGGGMGRYEDRVPYRLEDCKKLMKMFPGLFRYREREGFVPKTDLAVNLHTSKQIRVWRLHMLRQRMGFGRI